MLDVKRLEKIEKKAEAQAPRRKPARPVSYYESLCAMTYKQLEAEQSRLQAGRERELKKLNGQLPPFGVQPDHPGWGFDTCERRSWLADTVLGPRLDRDIADIANRHNASSDPELRKRLRAEYDALLVKLHALEARCGQRDKWMKERDKVTDAARKEQCVSRH